jgi:hypothetical protein
MCHPPARNDIMYSHIAQGCLYSGAVPPACATRLVLACCSGVGMRGGYCVLAFLCQAVTWHCDKGRWQSWQKLIFGWLGGFTFYEV